MTQKHFLDAIWKNYPRVVTTGSDYPRVVFSNFILEVYIDHGKNFKIIWSVFWEGSLLGGSDYLKDYTTGSF